MLKKISKGKYKKISLDKKLINKKLIYFILFLCNIIFLYGILFLSKNKIWNDVLETLIIFSYILWSTGIIYSYFKKNYFLYFLSWLFWIILLSFENFLIININYLNNYYLNNLINISDLFFFKIGLFQLILVTFFIIFFYNFFLKKQNSLNLFFNDKTFCLLILFIAPLFSFLFLLINNLVSITYIDSFFNYNVFLFSSFFIFLIYFYNKYFLKKDKKIFEIIFILLSFIFYIYLSKDIFVIFIPLLFWSFLFLLFIVISFIFFPIFIFWPIDYFYLFLISFIVINFLMILISYYQLSFISLKNNKKSRNKNNLILYLGGKENIINSTYCLTRIRLELKNVNLLNEKSIIEDGALGIIKNDKTIHIVYGYKVENIYKKFFS